MISKDRRNDPELRMYGLMNSKMSDEEIDAQEENKKRATRLKGEFGSLRISANDIVLTNDFHTPCQDRLLVERMYRAADEYGIKKLAVIGDFWDCDFYKNTDKYTNLMWFEAFKDEKRMVAEQLTDLLVHFKEVYFCRGNHEMRWIKQNKGMVGMDELFAITKVKGNYKVSLDDHIVLDQGDKTWLLIHPEKYNDKELTVSKNVCEKVQCNVVSGHGHQLARGFDKTGTYRVVDNGGMFDADQIEYLRRTTTFPSVMSGFNLLMDNYLIEYPGHGASKLF